jgi:hypothetical protein
MSVIIAPTYELNPPPRPQPPIESNVADAVADQKSIAFSEERKSRRHFHFHGRNLHSLVVTSTKMHRYVRKLVRQVFRHLYTTRSSVVYLALCIEGIDKLFFSFFLFFQVNCIFAYPNSSKFLLALHYCPALIAYGSLLKYWACMMTYVTPDLALWANVDIRPGGVRSNNPPFSALSTATKSGRRTRTITLIAMHLDKKW